MGIHGTYILLTDYLLSTLSLTDNTFNEGQYIFHHLNHFNDPCRLKNLSHKCNIKCK